MPKFDINDALSDPRVALGIGLLSTQTPQQGIAQGIGLLSQQSQAARQRSLDDLERRYKEAQIKHLDDPSTSFGKLIAERDALAVDDPRRALYDAQIEKENTISNPYVMGPNPYQLMQLQNQQDERDYRHQQESDRILRDRQDKIEKVSVPGFDIQEGILPSSTDAEALKKAAQNADVIKTQLADLHGLVTEYGTEYGFGDHQARMQNDAERIKLNLKELENLGVLNGPDVEVLNRSFMNPTDLSNQFRSNKTILNSFDNFGNYLDQRVDSTAKARGYKRQGNSSSNPPSGKFNSSGQQSLMTSLPDASKHNGRVVVDTETGQRLRSNGQVWVPQ